MTVFDSLTGFYPLAKTLPVKLTPMGSTLQNIRVNGIIENDEELLENFTRLKQLADEYHKEFIATVLENFKFKVASEGNNDSLSEFAEAFDSDRKQDADARFRFTIIRTCLRLAVAKAFEAMPDFKKLEKKEFVKDILRQRATSDDVPIIDSFSKFTTYMLSYNRTRRIYGYDEKANTVAYRCVDENLPIFYNNIKAFAKIREHLPQDIMNTLCEEMKPYLKSDELAEMFTLGYFNECLSQKGIEAYNAVLGGINTPNGHIKGLKEYIYLYNKETKEKKFYLPSLTSLKKQILSDHDSLSWIDTKYNNSHEMLQDIRTFHETYRKNVAHPLQALMAHIHEYDLHRIYIANKENLAPISLRLCAQWNALRDTIFNEYSAKIQRKRKETFEKYEKRVNKAIDDCGSFSLAEVNRFLMPFDKNVADYFTKMGAVDNHKEQRENLFATIENKWTDLLSLMEQDEKYEKVLQLTEHHITKIKAYLDAVMDLHHFVLPLQGEGNENDREPVFYDTLGDCLEVLQEIKFLYNRVRAFLTRKPFSTKKLKLNFGSSTLLSGWNTDNEKANRCTMLRKDGRNYLVIFEKGQGELFRDESMTLSKDEPYYEKFDFNIFGDPVKSLPHTCFAACNADFYKPSAEILQIREKGSYKAGKNFNLPDLHKMIDFYKACVKKMPKWGEVQFNWKETTEYENLTEFMESFIVKGYFIDFLKVSERTVNKWVDEGRIYLFRLDKRDYSPFSKGKKSLHTMYLDMLFHPDNLEKMVYKLSGGCEMFFRKASIKPSGPTHPAGQPIANKSPEVAEKKPVSTFAYHLIKDKRYTEDMFMIHLPVAVNYHVPDSKGMKVTAQVRHLIRQGLFKHVIGIHRGERNLLYVTVTDMQGHIVEQKSLNVIEDSYAGVTHAKDYNELLQRKGEQRTQSRKDWQTIDKIRDIKQGYLSQAINVITNMILQYEALVVLESLDDRSKRGRQKIEKNIYARFEQQLVDKLNFLVKKDRDLNEPGGLLNALQLTDRVEPGYKTFQNGIIFYVPAAYTANACPVTGFVNLFNFKKGSIEETKAFFSKFDGIRFNKQTGEFDFTFDYVNFTDKAEGTQTEWTMSSHGCRSHWTDIAGRKICKMVELTEEFKNLFIGHGVDFTGNLKEAIATVNKRSFYEGLSDLFILLLQMRNVVPGVCDYFVSPVKDREGKYFISTPEHEHLPSDTDAVTAYNIARKGLLMVDSIVTTHELDKLSLGVTNQIWMNHIQNQDN